MEQLVHIFVVSYPTYADWLSDMCVCCLSSNITSILSAEQNFVVIPRDRWVYWCPSGFGTGEVLDQYLPLAPSQLICSVVSRFGAAKACRCFVLQPEKSKKLKSHRDPLCDDAIHPAQNHKNRTFTATEDTRKSNDHHHHNNNNKHHPLLAQPPLPTTPQYPLHLQLRPRPSPQRELQLSQVLPS